MKTRKLRGVFAGKTNEDIFSMKALPNQTWIFGLGLDALPSPAGKSGTYSGMVWYANQVFRTFGYTPPDATFDLLIYRRYD